MKKIYQYLFNNLLKSELIGNLSVLVTGTVIAQLISIILQPFLRRYFNPEDFGLLSVYLSLVGMVLIVTTLRYDDAIILPQKDKESINVLALSIILNFLLNLIFFIIVIIWGKQILRLLNLPENVPVSILYIVPVSVFLYNSFQCFNYWLIRKKRYYNVSYSKMLRRGFEGALQSVFALLRNGKGLIYGDVVGQIANVTYAISKSVKHGFNYQSISFTKIKYVFRKYSEFPKYNLLPAFMSASSYLLPPIFINKYYSAEYAGYFDLSKLLLSIPLALIATSISNVILQKVAEKFRINQSFYKELGSLLIIISFICISEFIIIYFWGIKLFTFVFGNNWEVSGTISRILVWSFILNFLVSSFSSIFIAMRKIKIYSIWQLAYFLGIISLLFFKEKTFFRFLNIYVVIEVVYYLSLIIIMILIIINYEKKNNFDRNRKLTRL